MKASEVPVMFWLLIFAGLTAIIVAILPPFELSFLRIAGLSIGVLMVVSVLAFLFLIEGSKMEE